METSTKKRNRWIWTIVAAGVILILISFVVIRVKEVEHIPPQNKLPWALNTATAHRADVTRGYPVLAALLHQDDVTLTAQIGGTLTKMGPREGIAVKRGSFLAQIDTRTIQDEISGLQARLVAAKADKIRKNEEYRRERKLMEAGGSSQSALDAWHTAAIAADNQVKSLEHQIQALTVKEDYGRITSPVNGVIAARLHEPGDVIMPGQPVYRISSDGGVRIHVEFPQDLLHNVKKETVLQLFYNSDTTEVRLDRIYPLVNGFDLAAADADLQQPPFNVANGARLPGRIVLESDQTGIKVPSGALISNDSGKDSYLFKVLHKQDGNVIQKVAVTILLSGQHGVSVRGDIHPGDQVIVAQESVLLSLKDGDPVIVKQRGTL